MKKNVKKLSAASILVLVLFFLPTTAFSALPPGFEVETVAFGFTQPTAVAFLPDGRILVAQKNGTVRILRNGILLTEPFIRLSDVNNYGDRGLIGIAVDPNFEANGFIYLQYTFESTPGANFAGPKNGRLVRVTATGDTADESTKVVILGTVSGTLDTPSCANFAVTADCIASDTSSHSVGGLRFGPDGKLYSAIGDGAHFDYVDSRALRSQDRTSLNGKILRLNTDGTAPNDNPFYNGSRTSNISKIYGYGFRNSFRFNFHPVTGRLYAGDVGWSLIEEVDLVTPGGNYGWPCREGLSATSYACIAPSYVNPLYAYSHDANGAGSVTGGDFGTAYPAQFANTMFFGDYAQNWIKMLNLDSTGNFVSVSPFMEPSDGPDGPVEFLRGLDGNVYFLSIYTGELRRILYTTGNRQPVAVIAATPTSGALPLTVSFSALNSHDPDGNALGYLWNFGDGITSTAVSQAVTYSVAGSYTAVLTVSDSFGGKSTRSQVIVAGNQRPSATIVTPVGGSLYRAGEVISISASAIDPEDGALPAGAYAWTILLHHNTHTHQLQTLSGPVASFVAPSHEGASDVYTEVRLRVTDSVGLTDIASVNIYLNNNPSESGNLILNPSIEDTVPSTATSPDRWQKGGYGLNAADFSYPVIGFNGDKAARVRMLSYTDGDAKWAFEAVSVDPSTSYRFSGYYISNVPTSLILQVGNSASGYQYVSMGNVPSASTWTKVERVFTTPANARNVVVFHIIAQVGTLDIDNYSLTRASVVPLPDTTQPDVSIIAPAANAAVSGVVNILGNAADNVGVAGVQFLVDGIAVGAEDTVAPYSSDWNTALMINGPHTISALARDAAGNNKTAVAVTVVVMNVVPSSNLISNGDLETLGSGADPAFWKRGAWGVNTTAFTYPTVGHNGNKAASLRVSAYTNGDAKLYPPDVSMVSGTLYTFSDWYRSSTISDVIGRYTMNDGSYHYFGVVKEIPPSAVWTKITTTFTPPATALSVTFMHLISAVGTLDIDDMSLIASGTATSTNDVTAPTATITTPLSGATVTGDVLLSAVSTDNIGVHHVWFAVDGNQVSANILAEPYNYLWNSKSVSNGTHLIKVTTVDAAGNNSTATTTIVVSNVPPVSTNLVANPGMETLSPVVPGTPLAWNRGSWGTNNAVFTYPVSGYLGGSAAQLSMSSYTSGDAKWYSDEILVTPGVTYNFSNTYVSSVTTAILVRYTSTAGVFSYGTLTASLPASATWRSVQYSFTAPANVRSVSIMHILSAVGTLSTDSYILVDSTIAGNPDRFSQGMVSLTFDDGWMSHYLTALPILNAAGLKGVFGVVSQETIQAVPDNRIANASLEVMGSDGSPLNWYFTSLGSSNASATFPISGIDGLNAAQVELTTFRPGAAAYWSFENATVIPGQDYTYTEFYRSDVSTTLAVDFLLADTTHTVVELGAVVPSLAWSGLTRIIRIPTNAVSLTVLHRLSQSGTLAIDNVGLNRVQVFVNPKMVLAMQSGGHEISSHTRTHASLGAIPEAAMLSEVIESRNDLLGIGVANVSTIIFPYGETNAAVVLASKNAGYIGGRGVERGFNTKSTEKFALRVQAVDVTTTFAQITSWINSARTDKTWLILMYHQTDESGLPLSSSPTLLQEVADYLRTERISVVTLGGGLSQMYP